MSRCCGIGCDSQHCRRWSQEQCSTLSVNQSVNNSSSYEQMFNCHHLMKKYCIRIDSICKVQPVTMTSQLKILPPSFYVPVCDDIWWHVRTLWFLGFLGMYWQGRKVTLAGLKNFIRNGHWAPSGGIPSSSSLAFTLSSVDGWADVFVFFSFVSLFGSVLDWQGLTTTNSIMMRLHTNLIVQESRKLFLCQFSKAFWKDWSLTDWVMCGPLPQYSASQLLSANQWQMKRRMMVDQPITKQINVATCLTEALQHGWSFVLFVLWLGTCRHCHITRKQLRWHL